MQSKLCKWCMCTKTNIPALRKARRLSQEELARAVGVTRQTITSILSLIHIYHSWQHTAGHGARAGQ